MDKEGQDGIPMVSRSHPTVPSPPQQMTLKLGTSLNIWRPARDPPWSRLYTCRGLRRDWNFRRIRLPCLPPDLGLMKTRSGHMPGCTLIWKDMGDPEDEGCCFTNKQKQKERKGNVNKMQQLRLALQQTIRINSLWGLY